MRKSVYLLRHAESNYNYYGSIGETLPDHLNGDDLSNKGVAQAHKLVDKADSLFRGYDQIFCSPLNRAMHTIGPSLCSLGCKATIMPELHEIWYFDGFGRLSEVPQMEYRNVVPSEHVTPFIGNFEGQHQAPRYPSKEDRPRVSTRQCMILAASMRLGPNKRELYVGHGNLFAKLLEFLTCSSFMKFEHENCGLTKLVFKDYELHSIHFVNRKPV